MSDLNQLIPSWANILVIPGLLVGFTVHELAHALVAYRLGDESQIERGRISFNPLRHVFWLGFLTFFFLGFGWARPMRLDARNFQKPYLGILFVSLAGAGANLAMVGISLLAMLIMAVAVAAFTSLNPIDVLRHLTIEPASQPAIVAWTAAFTSYVAYVNLALAFFNLLPLPGLDGFSVVVSLVGLMRQPPLQPHQLAQRETGRVGATPVTGPPLTPSGKTSSPPVGIPARLAGTDSNALSGSRKLADIHFEHGNQYHSEGNYEDAIARYRQSIAQDDSYGPAYINMGLAYLSLGNQKRAIHAFNGAIQYASDAASRHQALDELNQISSQKSPNIQGHQEPPLSEQVNTPPAPEATTVPDWAGFWLRGSLILIGTICVYGVLTVGMIQYLA